MNNHVARYIGRYVRFLDGDQLLFLKTFGVLVQTVDLLRVKEVYDRRAVRGDLGEMSFSEKDIHGTVGEMERGRLNLIRDPRVLYQGARRGRVRLRLRVGLADVDRTVDLHPAFRPACGLPGFCHLDRRERERTTGPLEYLSPNDSM